MKYIIIIIIFVCKSMIGFSQKADLDSLVKMSPKLPSVLKFRKNNDLSTRLIPVKTFATNEKIKLCCCGPIPLYILDGKEITTFEVINPKSIESLEVLSKQKEIEKYGEKGKNGVIIITSKKK